MHENQLFRSIRVQWLPSAVGRKCLYANVYYICIEFNTQCEFVELRWLHYRTRQKKTVTNNRHCGATTQRADRNVAGRFDNIFCTRNKFEIKREKRRSTNSLRPINKRERDSTNERKKRRMNDRKNELEILTAQTMAAFAFDLGKRLNENGTHLRFDSICAALSASKCTRFRFHRNLHVFCFSVVRCSVFLRYFFFFRSSTCSFAALLSPALLLPA